VTKPEGRPPSRTANLVYTVVAGQVGCLTLVIVVVALLLGLWLDAQFKVRGPFTVGMLLLSVPLSLVLMVRIALGAINSIDARQVQRGDATQSEEE